MLITHEELFINTLKDLRGKINSNTPYDLIRACGLCRHLILDNHPLVHQANKKYKISLLFHIADYTNIPFMLTRTAGGFRTIQPIIEKTHQVNLHDFLQTKVLHSRIEEFSVREILLTASHYYGGIHSGNPDSKQKNISLNV